MSSRRLLAAVCALVCACGSSAATSTPPLAATAPAPSVDTEAAPKDRLPDDTHPLKYALSLSIQPDQPAFAGQVFIDLALDRPRESLYLHAKNLTASSVRVVRADQSVIEGKLESVSESGLSAVRLAQPVGPGNVRLEIVYSGHYDDGLAGLYRAKSGGDFYAFTQFEAISARKAFPCFDEPRFKTPFDVMLRVKKDHVAIANTKEVGSTDVEGGLRDVRFATTEKLPTYLVAVAVGPFDVVSAPDLPPTAERQRPLPLRGVAVKGRGPDLAYALRETPALVTALERYFAIAYPYDKLDIIAVPDFGAGAMENAGAITFRDTLLLVPETAPEGVRRSFAYVQAHELAHQWFGNLVTMPWWDDIWLNEAFATWMGTRVIAEVYPQYEAHLGQVASAQHAMDVDSQAGARQIRQPIQSDHDIANAFDSITYSKGGAVLSMFERYLGAERFREGLRMYMRRHAFGNATARDLTTALGEAAKLPAVSDAFFTFLEQPGVPLVTAQLDCSAEPTLVLSQSRYAPLGSRVTQGARWQIPVCVKLGDAPVAPEKPKAKKAAAGKVKEAAANTTRELCQVLSEPTMRVPLGATCPGWVMPNAGAAGYYRWSLPSEALEALVTVRTTLDASERMSLIANVDAAMHAGQIPADVAIAALLQMLADDERSVIESALAALNKVSVSLLDEETRPLLRAEIAQRVRPAFEKLGLMPKAVEPDGETKLLRAVLVEALAFAGRDSALREDLAKLGEAHLGLRTDPRLAKLPSELLEDALYAAVQVRGNTVSERAKERLLESQDGHERKHLLAALSSQRDPAATDAVLGLSLDERLRDNERFYPVMAQHAYPETRAAAYAWLKVHFDDLRKKLGEYGGAALLSAPGNLCSEAEAKDVEEAFASRTKDVMGGPRQLALAVESIRLCAAFEAAQGERARASLKALPQKTPQKTGR